MATNRPPFRVRPAEQTRAVVQATRQSATPTPLPSIDGPAALRSSIFLDGLKVPIALTFAPDGRLFFSEVFEGRVRIADVGPGGARLRERPFVRVEIAKGAESGMLGIAFDPKYAENQYVYLYYSEPDANRADRRPLRNRVVRYTERDGVGTNVRVILDDIEISRTARHNGGMLRFGPDGKLYITVGNAEDRANSQDLAKLNGKVLRINPDGSIPAENPRPGSPVFAHGFRNPYGLAIHPVTGIPYVTENSGDSHDEINRVVADGNYGFPFAEGPMPELAGPSPWERLRCLVGGPCPRETPPGPYVDPVWESGPRTIGPSGIAFYTRDAIPQFKGDLFFCAVNTGLLTRLRLAAAESDRVVGSQELASDCHLDVTDGPDGALYYSNLAGQIVRLGP